ncbi:MAG: DUF4320 family protein [Clostridia bacterium]|nr:DUF4320 family protein [Clostridia bacterium]
MYKLLKSKKGEGYTDVIVIILSAMLVIVLSIKVFPVFIAKHQLDTFASELCRTAEISGQIGTETTTRAEELQKETGIRPVITWSASYISGTSKVQLNQKMEVTLKYPVRIGIFSEWGAFPIELTAKSTGRSEVYWK